LQAGFALLEAGSVRSKNMSTANFTAELEAQIIVNATAVGNLDAFYLLVCSIFIFYMQVSWNSGMQWLCALRTPSQRKTSCAGSRGGMRSGRQQRRHALWQAAEAACALAGSSSGMLSDT
jgi:hypothetical protein